jgi:arylsulfatase
MALTLQSKGVAIILFALIIGSLSSIKILIKYEYSYDLPSHARDVNLTLDHDGIVGGEEDAQFKSLDGGESNTLDTKPLNILLLYADDWSFKTLGAITPFVKTPNIDRMAKNGVLFTHNCVTTSICMVSRATLYTGQYASRHKTYHIWKNNTMFGDGIWNSTLFPLLAQHGYHNGMVGKWHHSEPPNVDETFGMFRNYYGDHYVERDEKEYHVTDLNEADAIDFLNERPKDKPFALMVSFFATHAEDGEPEQYRPQNRTEHLYKNETVPIPKTATDEHFKALPPFLQNPHQYGRSRWSERYETPELYQEMMKKTYRMVTEVDTACGAILEKLKEQNILNETLIIFTTDNGNMHGEHGLAEKCK